MGQQGRAVQIHFVGLTWQQVEQQPVEQSVTQFEAWAGLAPETSAATVRASPSPR